MIENLSSYVNGVISDLRAEVQNTAESDENDSDSDGETSRDIGLFHCSACGTVYIAPDKQECSRCETPVEQVPSTLEAA